MGRGRRLSSLEIYRKEIGRLKDKNKVNNSTKISEMRKSRHEQRWGGEGEKK